MSSSIACSAGDGLNASRTRGSNCSSRPRARPRWADRTPDGLGLNPADNQRHRFGNSRDMVCIRQGARSVRAAAGPRRPKAPWWCGLPEGRRNARNGRPCWQPSQRGGSVETAPPLAMAPAGDRGACSVVTDTLFRQTRLAVYIAGRSNHRRCNRKNPIIPQPAHDRDD